MAHTIYKLLKQCLAQTQQWFCRPWCPGQNKWSSTWTDWRRRDVWDRRDKKKFFLKSVPEAFASTETSLSPCKDKMSSTGTAAGQREDTSCFRRDQRPWPSYRMLPSERRGWRESRTLLAVLSPTPEPWKRHGIMWAEPDVQLVSRISSLVHSGKTAFWSFTHENPFIVFLQMNYTTSSNCSVSFSSMIFPLQ